MSADLIYHHYPQSPVSEKVRKVFGLKGLSWQSVEVPRLPPKPKLVALTGGYRRTPVLQVGADIYCDSFLILKELERRHPVPSLVPEPVGDLVWGLIRWTGGEFFQNCLTVVLGHKPEDLPPEFAKDRGRLYFGPRPDFDEILKSVPNAAAQLNASLSWMESALSGGNPYLTGPAPSVVDATGYALCWLIRGRWDRGAELLSRFQNLEAWEARMEAVGQGTPTEMDADAALDIAAKTETEWPEHVPDSDLQGLRLGQRLNVTPLGDGGDPTVTGALHYLDADRVAIRPRLDDGLGQVVVHFPRIGFRVAPTEG